MIHVCVVILVFQIGKRAQLSSFRTDGHNVHLVVEEACSDLDAVVAHGSAASAHKSLKNQTKRPHARVHAAATVTPVKHDINGNLKQKKQRNKLAVCNEKITLEGVMYSVSTFVHFLQWCSELAYVLGMTVKHCASLRSC